MCSGRSRWTPSSPKIRSSVNRRVPREGTLCRLLLRLHIELPLELPNLFRSLQAHANPLVLGSFKSVPEVRPLPSAGVTRLQRYYGPLRFPVEPTPKAPFRVRPPPFRASHVTQSTFPACHSHYPGERRWVRKMVTSPSPGGLPRKSGGSALTTALSRPAQDSHALRPARLQARPKADTCPLGFSRPVIRTHCQGS